MSSDVNWTLATLVLIDISNWSAKMCAPKIALSGQRNPICRMIALVPILQAWWLWKHWGKLLLLLWVWCMRVAFLEKGYKCNEATASIADSSPRILLEISSWALYTIFQIKQRCRHRPKNCRLNRWLPLKSSPNRTHLSKPQFLWPKGRLQRPRCRPHRKLL